MIYLLKPNHDSIKYLTENLSSTNNQIGRNQLALIYEANDAKYAKHGIKIVEIEIINQPINAMEYSYIM